MRDTGGMFALLETLIAVYETGQFTIAADELKVSQSTVSSRIASLEAMVGAPLFVRHAKSDVTPTEAGTLLYRAATQIGGVWRDAREEIARTRANREPFSMLVSHTAAAVLIPAALRATLGELDRFEIAVAASNSDGILERVGLKEAHLGVVEKPIINESVERVTLCEDELVLAGDPSGVWLVRERGSGVRYYTGALLHRAVFQDGGYRADARHRGGEQRLHRRRGGSGRGLFDRIAGRVPQWGAGA